MVFNLSVSRPPENRACFIPRKCNEIPQYIHTSISLKMSQLLEGIGGRKCYINTILPPLTARTEQAENQSFVGIGWWYQILYKSLTACPVCTAMGYRVCHKNLSTCSALWEHFFSYFQFNIHHWTILFYKRTDSFKSRIR